MLEVNLRSDYQSPLMDSLTDEWANGNNKVIAKCATGGGKGEMMAWLNYHCVKNDMPIITVVRNRELIKNASERYDKYKIPHGIYMAGSNRFSPSKMAQVCSIDTLRSRQVYPHADKSKGILIIDECQDAHDDSVDYQVLMETYKHFNIVGFTATPYSKLSKWDSLICSIEAYELRDRGYLVPGKYYCPEAQIDVSEVRINAGEFNQKDLFKAVSGSKIIGDAVQSWIEFAKNRPTVLFAVKVEHSLMLAEAFNKQGIKAMHCDANSSEKDRRLAKNGLENGNLNLVTNVNIFGRGWDCPPVACIQDMQPTRSLIRHLQKWGRGLRTCDGKDSCIYIDNAGNILRHGTPFRIHEVDLKAPKKKSSSKQLITLVNCKKCFFMYESDLDECPECGYAKEKKERTINQEDGELREYIEAKDEDISMIKVGACQSKIKELHIIAHRKKLPQNWVYKTVLNSFGENIGRMAGIGEDKIMSWKKNRK